MAKYEIVPSNSYNRDIKRLDDETIAEVEAVIDIIANGEKLVAKFKDHALGGNLKGFRDCHIKPDLVLIYRIYKKELILYISRVGSHGYLGL